MIALTLGFAAPRAFAAQDINVSGTVKDAKGEPVVGAVVADAGYKAVATTDIDGAFSLASSSSSISVSCLGYVTKTVKVQDGQKITIILEDDTTLLDDAVVVGYAVQSKANLTGAVATVDVGKGIVGRSTPDVGRGLQGLAAGLSVTVPDAEVGSDPSIKIRGAIGSIEGGSSPLILLDNVEIPSIQVVNAEDIESISVLKDAASTSIYGSRGAFGVILLTSKKGAKAEKVTVNYNAILSWQNMAKEQRMAEVNGIKYALDANARSKDSKHTGVNYDYDGVTAFSYIRANMDSYQRSLEWQEKYGGKIGPNDPMVYGRDWYYSGDGNIYGIRTYDVYDYMVAEWTPSQQHTASINGMIGKTTFNVGLGYIDESGMMKTAKNDSYQKYNASVKLETEVKKWLTVRAGIMYNQRQKNYPFITDDTSYSPWLYLYRWSCLMPYGYDEMGHELRGPISEARQSNTATRRYNYTNVNVGATITPLENWNIVADYSYSNQDYIMTLPGSIYSGASYRDTPQLMIDEDGNQVYVNWDGNVVPSTDPDAMQAYYFKYLDPYEPTSDNRYFAREHENSFRHTFNGYTDYSIKFRDHSFKAMVGMNLTTYDYTSQFTKVMNLSDYQNPQFAFGTGVWTGEGSAGWDSQLGFFGRLNYNYKDKYLFEANIRRDGSSKFPKALKWAWFPSFSGAWRVIEEPWMAFAKPYVSAFKIRASWGSLGDQTVSSSLYIPTLSTGQTEWISNGALTSYASTPSTVSAGITWQRIQTTDIGVDARFLDSHVGVSFDWFNRDTKDMIVPTDGVNTTTFGASAPKANNGWLRTTGWELQIDGDYRFSNGLGINATFNLADAKSTIMKYGDTKSLSSWYVGKTYGEIWGFEVDRLYQMDDFVQDESGNLIYRELTAEDTDDPNCIGKLAYILKPGPNGEKPVYQAYYQGGSFIYGPGDVKYKDKDGDGKLSYGTKTTDDHGDWSIIGNETPRFEYSLRLGADWKGFDISILFQGVGSRQIWGKGPLCIAGDNVGDGAMAAAIADDYWTPENTDAFWPAAYSLSRYSNSDYNYMPNDRYILDMSYFRVKNLTVGYTLPRKWMNAINIEKVRIYFTAENFLTFDNLRGLPIDPECVTGKSMWGSNYAQGNTGFNTPVFKTVSAGLQVTF
ncbi:MAG: SusC/RagA family TonB-linked outer membrane protein [Bacteroidales bacterium]|nr:SusC/RagA family TonB-linked outer membrane protein [Bacteroidales bacterium]